MIIEQSKDYRLRSTIGRRKFFIFPFKCELCGNRFMLEYGYKFRKDIRLDKFREGYLTFFYKNEKVCDICSKEIIDELKKKWGLEEE